MIRPNIILDTDSYKLAHWDMMTDGTTGAFDYFGARTGALYPRFMFFGLQPYLMDMFEGEVVTREHIEEAQDLQRWHMPPTRFNLAGWKYIVEHYGGRLPLLIKAAKEGTVLPAGVPMFNVRNTDLTNTLTAFLPGYVEPILSKVWYTSIIATRDWRLRNRLLVLAKKSGVDPAVVDYMFHGFGYRGVSSEQSAGLGDMAHLVSFNGTDTIKGMRYAMHYYGARPGVAHSVAATQHDVATGLGEAGEHIVSMRVINRFQNQIVSEVADSYDYKRFVLRMIDAYKEIKAARVKLVIRPDSLVGDLDSPKKVVQWTLGALNSGRLDVTTTPTGHVVLPYSVLYGDGIDDEDAYDIAADAVSNGYALSNLVFGAGGGMLQKVHRDMGRFAYKGSAQYRDGEWHDQAKATPGKESTGGLVTTRFNPLLNEYYAVDERKPDFNPEALEPVLHNGTIVRKQTFDNVREIARAPVKEPPYAEPERSEPVVSTAQA